MPHSNKKIILDSESFNKGVPYADAFTVRSLTTITYIDENKCHWEQKYAYGHFTVYMKFDDDIQWSWTVHT